MRIFYTEPGIDHKLNIIGVVDEVQLHSNKRNFMLLKNFSPYCLKDSIFGIYAYVSDSYSLILDGINRFFLILELAMLEEDDILRDFYQ